jgi:integrase/recombinase XerD
MPQTITIPAHKRGTCLDPHIPSFDASLRSKNFKQGTIRQYRMSIRRLASWMESADVPLDQMTPNIAAELVRDEDRDPRRPTWNQNLARRFVQHLIRIGVVPKPVATPQESARAELRACFEDYLLNQRGLCRRRVYNAWRIADRFLDHRFGADIVDLGVISARAFIEGLAGVGGRFRNRAATSLVRLLLQYLFSSGATRTNLALCIPKVAQRRYANVPRYLPSSQIEKILDAVRFHPKHGLRGYAMILLMARLGLRAPEVIAIQLDDVDWRTGELLVRGKGGRHDRVPIPPDVGEALARYVRNERVSTSRALFVKRQADNGPFKDGQIINAILRDAFAASGVKPSGRYIGSHILRHSLATNLVRNGASLEEISDLLRHRARATTMIYAKVDTDGLRSIAQPWPVTGGIQ